jgi:hypothetical protein
VGGLCDHAQRRHPGDELIAPLGRSIARRRIAAIRSGRLPLARKGNRQTDSFACFRQEGRRKIIRETLRAQTSQTESMVYAILKSTCEEAAMHVTLVAGLVCASAVNAMLLLSYLHA